MTLSRDRIVIRFGAKLFTVRPQRIKEALAAAAEITARSGETWLTPMLLDRSAEADFHGRIHPKASPFLTKADVAVLTGLGAGERWALAYLMRDKPLRVEKPAAITSLIANKIR